MQANTQQVLRGEDEQTEAYTAPRCGQGRKSPRAAPRPSEGPDLPLRPWQLVPATKCSFLFCHCSSLRTRDTGRP